MSTAGSQLPVEPARWVESEVAVVAWLPKKSCECDAPARPGSTIGSSGSRWLSWQSAGNSATRITADAALWFTDRAASDRSAASPTVNHLVLFFLIEDKLPRLFCRGPRERSHSEDDVTHSNGQRVLF